MLKKISSLPFQGTPEQEAQLKEVIAKHKDDPGAVMPVLQEAQDIYGYLPLEVQQMIAEGLNVPVDEVYGVTSAYAWVPLAMSRAPATYSTGFLPSSASRLRNAPWTVSSR